MDTLLRKIGWAAGDIHRHAHLLTIDRDDPKGSAAVDDEEDLEEKDTHIVDEDDRLDDDDLDDQPRGKRSDQSDKSAKAYDALKSERDRLIAENARKDKLIEDFNARLARIEQQRETREDVNRQTDEANAQAEARARELAAKVRAIANDDPERTEKVYALIEKHNEERFRVERERLMSEIDQRSSRVVEQRLTREEQAERSERLTLKELERQGLPQEYLDLVQDMAASKLVTDRDWFKRVPDAEQIPELVKEFKERLMRGKRSSQAFKDEKRRHREDQDGVLGETATTRRGSRQEDDGDDIEGPGSSLADIARLRKERLRDSARMLRTR